MFQPTNQFCMSCANITIVSSQLFHEATVAMTNKQPGSNLNRSARQESNNPVASGSNMLGCGLLNLLPIFPLESVGSPSRAPPESWRLWKKTWGPKSSDGETIHVRETDNDLTQSRLLLFLSQCARYIRYIPCFASRGLIEGLPVFLLFKESFSCRTT